MCPGSARWPTRSRLLRHLLKALSVQVRLWKPQESLFKSSSCRREGGDKNKQRRAHQASDERVHGVVSDEAAPDSAGQPEDAQLGDLEAARLWVEAALRDGQETVHRRGQEDPRQAHDRPPGLQVPAKEEAKVRLPKQLPRTFTSLLWSIFSPCTFWVVKISSELPSPPSSSLCWASTVPMAVAPWVPQQTATRFIILSGAPAPLSDAKDVRFPCIEVSSPPEYRGWSPLTYLRHI